MKKIIFLLIVTLFLSACANQKQEIISVENDKKIENKVVTQVDIYSTKTEVTFRNEKDIKKFKADLKKINKEISSNTGSLSYEQVVSKARLLDYLGDTGKALKLYEDNFSINNNDKSLAYNHNMARLYEKLGAYDEALKRYGFLIKYFNRADYLKDVANVWKKRGDEEKYDIAMKKYNKVMKKDNTKVIETQNIKVGKNGILELK